MTNVHPPAFPQDLITSLQAARHIVVFTGAGVSAESGIPTFRDALTGLWERFDAEDLATSDAFRRDEDLVWGWYEWRRMKVLGARPNAAHASIAALVRHVPRVTVVTQNVDDLHERAGSHEVLHLHGSLHEPRCFDCSRAHVMAPEVAQEPAAGRRLRPPHCSHCGGSVRPGVVWFGENLSESVLDRAFAEAKACDMLIAIGTSGLVHPAARLPGLAKASGARVVQVNPTSTPLDSDCDWSLRGEAGKVMPQLLQAAFPSAD